ncbi:hypothetical protein CC86DRAFT_77752 [Ophiobolus disseminans]|uniref:Uncharacterized protein n=1 Tax=Ophiobolus disseminans TaxID=1469910 RepID=A0A6A6ZPX1_9PLEO|nr:hypothetical protein CC86DRAFT_77752 [Ophiobolus disseminans]
MVRPTSRLSNTPSAGYGRHGTIGKQKQALDFIEHYDSDDSFRRQGKQPQQRQYGTYGGENLKFGEQTRQRPYGTYDGRKFAFEEQPKQRPYGTYNGRKVAFEKQPKQPPFGTYAGGEIRFDGNEDEDDYNDEDYYDEDSEYDAQEHLVAEKEEKAYALIFAFTSCTFFFFPQLTLVGKLIICLGAYFLIFPVRDVVEASEYVDDTSQHGDNAPERRQSYEPREPIPKKLVPAWFSLHNYIMLATDPTAIDEYVIAEHWQARRLSPEALRNYWPHFRRGSAKFGKHLWEWGWRVTFAHGALQLLVTLVQALGAHFYEGRDIVGLFPRYLNNVASLENLFGVAGTTALRNHLRLIFGWWWSWIYGLTCLFLWYLSKLILGVLWDITRSLFRTLWWIMVQDNYPSGHVAEGVNATTPLGAAGVGASV